MVIAPSTVAGDRAAAGRVAVVVVAFALVGACGFPTPSDELACATDADCDAGRVCDRGYCVVGDDGGGNGAPDAPAPDAALHDLCASWHPAHFDPCTLVAPGGTLELYEANVYDTGTGILTYPGGAFQPPSQTIGTARVVSVAALEVTPGASLRVTGPYALIVAAWSTITVDGTIDAGSHPTGAGPGANPDGCTGRAAVPGGNSGTGAGGGGGGGYGGTGGAGGTGDAASGGDGGLAISPVVAADLLGGCPGATGGTGDDPGGAGGSGGGSLQLTARESIAIAGAITVGGAGGAGGSGGSGLGDAGGGGGGSGGWLGLDAPAITVGASAVLAANGGGGGGGSGNSAGAPGADGAATAIAAIGGDGDGGPGGTGSAGYQLDGATGGPSIDHGGGGGGGATGRIVVISPSPELPPTAIVSPAPTLR